MPTAIILWVGVTAVFLQSFIGRPIPRDAVDLTKIAPPYRIDVYRGGSPQFERAIARDSEEERAITAWLKRHKSKWHRTFDTVAPSRRIRGEGFDLNFSGRSCILNYRAGPNGRWVQMFCDLDKGDPIPKIFHVVP